MHQYELTDPVETCRNKLENLIFDIRKMLKKITLLDSSAASIIDGLLQLDMESSAGLVWIVTSLVAALLGQFIYLATVDSCHLFVRKLVSFLFWSIFRVKDEQV